jgi:hypothetical protein
MTHDQIPNLADWGRLLEKVDALVERTDALHKDVTGLKAALNKGWGVVVGAVAIIGLFAGELITGIKRLIGIG